MDVSTQIIVASTLYKITSLLVGAFVVYLGYRLFMAGVWGRAGDVEGQFKDIKLLIKRGAPGTFFVVLGAIIICVTIIKDFDLSHRGQTSPQQLKSFKETVGELPKKEDLPF